METDREMEREIVKLKKAIRHLVVRSKEFARLRHLLRTGTCELQIYLIPLLINASNTPRRKRRSVLQSLTLDLTNEDRRFLKEAGIKF